MVVVPGNLLATAEVDAWYLEEGAACIRFLPGAVTQPALFTRSLWSPKALSPPLHCNEALVSNVVELSSNSPPDLKSSEDVQRIATVALLHSASELKGYELVIKQLVDPDNNECSVLGTWLPKETLKFWI